ncbi:MAG: uroporphyrinogen-III C-methyltransferase [Acidobacteria bacterium]|nr:uroporphyrinogen-III C-methyltransferase [Acidobacteriota bacterium]
MMGFVSLVGAGPGAADLLTLRAVSVLQQADCVLYDRLIDPAVLDYCPETCERVFVGKRPGRDQAATQGMIMDVMVQRARKGMHVVRLKGGDPFVYGRGGEEIAVLISEGISYEVVPGLSSVVAAPAAAGIPLTYRGLAASFGVFTAQRGKGLPPADLEAAARVDTAVILMGAAAITDVAHALRRHGRAAWTPVAVISHATLPQQSQWIGTLSDLEQGTLNFESPATIVVGPTVTVLTQPVAQTRIS